MFFDTLKFTGDFKSAADYIFSYAHLYKLTVSIAILLVFLLFRNLVVGYVLNFFFKLFRVKAWNGDQYLLAAFKNPLKLLFVFAGVALALKNYLPAAYHGFINSLLSSAIIIFVADGMYKLVGVYAANEAEIGRLFNDKVDKILIPFFSKMLKFVIVALAFVVVLSEWGYDISGFIAGLGLGGLAFALAAKDLLANIFSGIVIITDKPFSIGDNIKCSDVEGTVVDINFRSTRIKRLDESVVTVPNSNLVNAPIINFTKRIMRPINFTLGIRYDTPGTKLKVCMDKIEKMLAGHADVDKKTIFVKFESFGDSGMNMLIYCYATTNIWKEYLDIRQDINFKIMDILEEEGVEIAYPSSSVYLETPLKPSKDAGILG